MHVYCICTHACILYIHVYAYWAEVNYTYILVQAYLSCTVHLPKNPLKLIFIQTLKTEIYLGLHSTYILGVYGKSTFFVKSV